MIDITLVAMPLASGWLNERRECVVFQWASSHSLGQALESIGRSTRVRTSADVSVGCPIGAS